MSATRPGDPRQVGPYRVVGRLGAGGMGQVFLGRSPAGRTVAVKVIHPAMAEDGDFKARFRREITAARAVGGGYTAPVVDADPDASPPWLATTYLRGMSLQDAVAAHGPLPPPAVRALGAGLAEALRSIHAAGIVHRDLKPSNVMLTPEGPRVIDFGLARPSEATTLTRTGATLGTPAYMSPEQASGLPAGPPSDVFSFGSVLTYAATGTGPFGVGALHEMVYRVMHLPPYLDAVPDPGLRALIAACMEKDPDRRPGTDRLLAELSADPAAAPQGTHWLPPQVAHDVAQRGEATVPGGPSRRRLLAIGAAGVAFTALAAGGTGATFLMRRGDDPVRWTFALPGGMYVRTRLVAHGGAVFAFGSAGLSGATFAIDARTGKQKWRGSFTAARDSAAALLDGRGFLYDSSGNLLTGFELATGKTLWTEQLRTFGLAPSPVAGSGVVCLTGSGGTGEYGLYGYDAATGRPRWRYRADDLLQSRAVLSGDTCYFGTRKGFVYGVDVTTGNARWQRRTGGPATTTPMVAGDVVAVLTGDGAVLGLDAATGRQRWRTDLGDDAATDAPEGLPVGVAGGLAFVGGPNGTLHAIEPATGRVRWKRPGAGASERGGSRGFSIPSVGGGLAVVTDDEGRVAALDAATGEPRWERGVDKGLGERPLISGSLVYYGAVGGMSVFDLASGRTRYRFEFEDVQRVVGSTQHYTAAGGTVYCVVDNAVVQAIRPEA
ncbi:serine/threonine-protein kinase [Actinomadura livida]|uniref:Outer membrane protein assembly factor BamB n=1 Tax=Actinomadura livida TaxID=79909 RepID=A0A7W7N1W7_9ACTN|nr:MULTISPECIES: serine/threonine-protein kinase [Actinomadura]MBB4778579.1 outer membrane protein assembly factor BamB [Actinomadura catellatispora]GGU29990.1 serine/threonine protein kinase [Actinomadura livida]